MNRHKKVSATLTWARKACGVAVLLTGASTLTACMSIRCGSDRRLEGSRCVLIEEPIDVGEIESATVVLRFPWNGYDTGSLHASPERAAEHPLKPRLMWEGVENARFYQIELSDDCQPGGYADCDTNAQHDGEADVHRYAFRTEGAETELIVPEPLAVPFSLPVGGRYVWRVRACATDEACSAWSPGRYIDVGRLKADYNGDGFADLALGDRWSKSIDTDIDGDGQVLVYPGASTALEDWPPEVTRLTQALDACSHTAGFGTVTEPAGDLNGDGYGDLAIGAPEYATPGCGEFRGRVWVYYGGPGDTGSWTVAGWPEREDREPQSGSLATGAIQALDAPFPATRGFFGSAIAAPGDIDGDGYDDLVVASERDSGSGPMLGVLDVFLGSASGLSTRSALRIEAAEQLDEAEQLSDANGLFRFARNLGGLGDIDGDGLVDLWVRSDRPEPDADAPGRLPFIDLYLGQSLRSEPLRRSARWQPYQEGSPSVPRITLAGGSVRDLNHDGLADWAVGLPRDYLEFDDANVHGVAVFLGSRELGADAAADAQSDAASTPAVPSQLVLPPAGRESSAAFFGAQVAFVADADGDGMPELMASSANTSGNLSSEAALQLYPSTGSPEEGEVVSSALLRVTTPASQVEVEGGEIGFENQSTFGLQVATLDLDGDGDDELIVANPRAKDVALPDSDNDNLGALYLYETTQLAADHHTPHATWLNPGPTESTGFGAALAGP